MTPNSLQITIKTFNYWKNWCSVPQETTSWALDCDTEGLFWHDGHHATFWYLLNVSWYAMNDKLYAYTGCKEPFDGLLQDFDLDEYYS
jgi:hypothetical protein